MASLEEQSYVNRGDYFHPEGRRRAKEKRQDEKQRGKIIKKERGEGTRLERKGEGMEREREANKILLIQKQHWTGSWKN